MATIRIVSDINQHIPADQIDEIKAEIQSYVWGYIQNKYAPRNDTMPVNVAIHQHAADASACTVCVMHATDGKG